MKIITKVVDKLHPETRAMLQAFYSRSHMGIEERIEDLGSKEEKIKESLQKYYVNYGHESVGEGASITVFFEGISMLAAKAIQSYPLYRGQEGSTRYIDYSKQEFICPKDVNNSEVFMFWANRFRHFYTESFPKVVEYLRNKYEGSGKIYEKSLETKALDILRGYLPAGMSTKVAWTGSFRDIGVHLRTLLNHPLVEVRELAFKTYEQLQVDYPNSFRSLRETDYYDNKYFYNLATDNIDRKFSSDYKEGSYNLNNYNKDNPLYKLVRIESNFNMDFASFRDLQRHRNMITLMPILTTKIGVDNFYVENLPPDLQDEAKKLLGEVAFCMTQVPETVYNNQYYVPMAFLCDVMVSMDLHQAVYLAKLRSQPTVHPTLRTWAQDLGRFLQKEFDISCNVNYDEDTLSLKRGTQDIIKKEDENKND